MKEYGRCSVCDCLRFGDPCGDCEKGYRAGLMKAARMASARASFFTRMAKLCPADSMDQMVNQDHAKLWKAHAADLRKLAKEDHGPR